jgi:hypothetical protein
MSSIHETVINDFGEVIMYATDIKTEVDKVFHPNNRTIIDDTNIKVKHLVQATTLEFIFPELPVEEYEPVEWLSNSTYMPYFNAYLIGLDLNSSFSYAGECIGKSLGLIDKTT